MGFALPRDKSQTLFMMEDILGKTLRKKEEEKTKKPPRKCTMMNWFIHDGWGFDHNIRAGWSGKAKIKAEHAKVYPGLHWRNLLLLAFEGENLSQIVMELKEGD